VDWLRGKMAGFGSEGSNYIGPLFVENITDDMSGIAIMARTSSQGGGGYYGLFYGSVADGTAPASTAWVCGLQQNSQNRTNLALVNTGEVDEKDNTFQIEIYDGSTGGKVTTSDSFSLKAKGWIQFSSLLASFAPSVTQGYARVIKVSGNNPFIAYAVINDGASPGVGTGDGSFLPAIP